DSVGEPGAGAPGPGDEQVRRLFRLAVGIDGAPNRADVRSGSGGDDFARLLSVEELDARQSSRRGLRDQRRERWSLALGCAEIQIAAVDQLEVRTRCLARCVTP